MVVYIKLDEHRAKSGIPVLSFSRDLSTLDIDKAIVVHTTTKHI